MTIYNDSDAERLTSRWRGPDELSASRLREFTRQRMRQAIRLDFKGRIVLLSSFGAEAAVLLHLVASIDPATPVLFLDTGKLFGETLRYRDQMVKRLRLTDVRTLFPDDDTVKAEDADGMLWSKDHDRCCRIRKVIPLNTALTGFDVVITGRKRYHGGDRKDLAIFDSQNGRLKFNPLVQWSEHDVENYLEKYDLPHHPLQKDGFLSIGCMTCTERVGAGQHMRDGRWQGSTKTECGIHLAHAPETDQ